MHVGWLTEFAGPQAEKVLDPRTQETTMIYHVFGGYTVGRVVCGGCGHESRTYQAVLDLPIEVTVGHRQHVSSVTAALRRNFCDTETLDGANKYKCGGCHAYVTAETGEQNPRLAEHFSGARKKIPARPRGEDHQVRGVSE